MVAFPLLSVCHNQRGYISHSDENLGYVLWVIPSSTEQKHVVFIRKNILDYAAYQGRTLQEILKYKVPEEACRMVCRDVIRSLKYNPDYVVVVHEPEPGNLTCSHTMDGILQEASKAPNVEFIKQLAEGDGGVHNVLGRHISDIIKDMVEKGHA